MPAKTIAEFLVGSVVRLGLPVDVQEADEVELLHTADGRVWLNVDGVCVFRAKKLTGKLAVETPRPADATAWVR